MDTNNFSLRTERVIIRHWRADEAEALFDIRRRPEVAKWLGDPEPWTSVDQARANMAAWQDEATLGVPSTCAIVPHATDVPVGSVTLHPMPTPGAGEVDLAAAHWLGEFFPIGGVSGNPAEVEIGWSLHPDSFGQGWATEAAAAMLAHGLSHGLRRVWAVMWAHNAPSAGVCRRIGMTELGVRVDPWYGSAADANSRFFIAAP
jgi:RimJ/RimL family protein N-acetyltransferase